jgi:Fe-S-cluster containining protein
MTLSDSDVKRIEEKGYKREEFLEDKDGFLILKNIEGQCFFLKNKKCSIYSSRPQGCRFYPLIYDFEKSEIVIDELCPNHSEFDVDDYDAMFEDVIIFVNEIVSEKEKREKKIKRNHKD